MKTGNGGFLAAVLSAGGSEDATNFSDQRAFAPQGARLVQKIAHLRSHISKASRSAEDNCVGFGKLVYRGDRNVGEASLSGLGAVFFEDGVGDEFRDLVQRNFRARDLLDAFSNSLGHFVNMAVHTVKNHLNFDAHNFPLSNGNAKVCLYRANRNS